MKTELIDLKLADWSRTVGMAMIERRATVQELIESAVSHVGDDLLRIAVAHAEQKTGLTYGKNKRAGDDREHMEWHAKCGCAYHPDPFPHVHPCSEAHKRPDLHAAQQQAPQAVGTIPADLAELARDRRYSNEAVGATIRNRLAAGTLAASPQTETKRRSSPSASAAEAKDAVLAKWPDAFARQFAFAPGWFVCFSEGGPHEGLGPDEPSAWIAAASTLTGSGEASSKADATLQLANERGDRWQRIAEEQDSAIQQVREALATLSDLTRPGSIVPIDMETTGRLVACLATISKIVETKP